MFQGTAPPPLHVFYEGLLKKTFELTFQTIQRQVSVREFNKLGRRIDAWLTAEARARPAQLAHSAPPTHART